MFKEKKDKGERRRRKEESVYNPFLYFMSFLNKFFYKPVSHLIQHKIDKQ